MLVSPFHCRCAPPHLPRSKYNNLAPKRFALMNVPFCWVNHRGPVSGAAHPQRFGAASTLRGATPGKGGAAIGRVLLLTHRKALNATAPATCLPLSCYLAVYLR